MSAPWRRAYLLGGTAPAFRSAGDRLLKPFGALHKIGGDAKQAVAHLARREAIIRDADVVTSMTNEIQFTHKIINKVQKAHG